MGQNDCATIYVMIGFTHPTFEVTTLAAEPPPAPVEQPRLLVVMGVSGSGKSTLAQALAEHYGFTYLDADDFHSDEAKAHMAAGKPLTDTMREPWVQSICADLRRRAEAGESCTLAFSGLRRAHRQQLRSLPFATSFLFLSGEKDRIEQRMVLREDHFMPVGLLESQLAALEHPQEERDVIVLDAANTLQEITGQCVRTLQ